jgi:hypothetical protein
MTNGNVIMNNELWRISEEKVVPYVGYCSCACLERLRKTTNILMQVAGLRAKLEPASCSNVHVEYELRNSIHADTGLAEVETRKSGKN